MTKKVQIKITGIQTLGEEKDKTVTCAEGAYELFKEVHRLEYEERTEEEYSLHTIINASERGVKIEKRGSINTDMLFIPGKKKEVKYETPYGVLMMVADCKRIHIEQEDNKTIILIAYTLYSGGEPVSECETEIEILEL